MARFIEKNDAQLMKNSRNIAPSTFTALRSVYRSTGKSSVVVNVTRPFVAFPFLYVGCSFIYCFLLFPTAGLSCHCHHRVVIIKMRYTRPCNNTSKITTNCPLFTFLSSAAVLLLSDLFRCEKSTIIAVVTPLSIFPLSARIVYSELCAPYHCYQRSCRRRISSLCYVHAALRSVWTDFSELAPRLSPSSQLTVVVAVDD